MTLAVAYKCTEGVLVVADRLERYLDGSPPSLVDKIYRHPWGLMVGAGRGNILTPAKSYLRELADDHVRVSEATKEHSPLDVIVGTIAAAYEALDPKGELEFYFTMPSVLVPAKPESTGPPPKPPSHQPRKASLEFAVAA